MFIFFYWLSRIVRKYRKFKVIVAPSRNEKYVISFQIISPKVQIYPDFSLIFKNKHNINHSIFQRNDNINGFKNW